MRRYTIGDWLALVVIVIGAGLFASAYLWLASVS